ncbi:MAG: ferredoxin--NADP reductase [Bacteroidia bacterium]
MPRAYILTISEIVKETPSAITLRFEQPAFGRIWYYPGQFVTLRVDINGVPCYRSYSISGVPQLDPWLAVTVKRVPGGLVSNYIADHFSPGQKVVVLEPRGRFYIETGLKNSRHLALFAAGSGITPIMSILRAILYQEPQSRITLVYANRKIEEMIFAHTLRELQQRFPDRLRVHYFFSEPGDYPDENDTEGRITDEKVIQIMNSAEICDAFYLCGPSGFMDTVARGLNMAGIGPEKIHREIFTADREEKKITQNLGPSYQVSVSYAGETWQLSVPAGATILEAALSQHINLPYSCRRGVCSTCMGMLKSGKVTMDQEDALLDFERERGCVLVCQAHPDSADVCIDIGESWKND